MPKSSKSNVYEQRRYSITNVEMARQLTSTFLSGVDERLSNARLGLPEVDDRYHVWRIPILNQKKQRLGEIVIDARTGEIDEKKSSEIPIIIERLHSTLDQNVKTKKKNTPKVITRSDLVNSILQGDSEDNLKLLPDGSIDLVFTSPPYFNARPDYSEYDVYEAYLEKMRRIIREAHRVLSEGRFFVINVSPVLIRRTSRSEASKRIPVPFDLNRVFVEEGYDFIDDIIWVKPEGAGWATGRGRRFAADRTPLQYKAVPVTEYVLVYRKHTDKLIDWNIRHHHNSQAVADSKISDNYEKTNVWKLTPAHSKDHPAIFPAELVERVIKYYSFKDDVVLDPFAGIGTLGAVAYKLQRRFVLSEMDPTYVKKMKSNLSNIMGKDAESIKCIGNDQILSEGLF